MQLGLLNKASLGFVWTAWSESILPSRGDAIKIASLIQSRHLNDLFFRASRLEGAAFPSNEMGSNGFS